MTTAFKDFSDVSVKAASVQASRDVGLVRI